ncbi:hypothetical protein P12x_004427 [Tundrisphaera lichenicola]|uniref:hypothetical protein n=1 Tax=Tundrisphaera lichenicola TaxID=2029860 RepID=UPI003EBE592C
MEYEPPPRDPESDARGHELRDVAIRPVLYFLIGLMLFGGVLQIVMSRIMVGYVKQDTKTGVLPMAVLSDPGSSEPISPLPPLQRDTTADMLRMYSEEDRILKVAQPTRDKRTGKLLVSIDEAIQIVAKKGLPHRDAPLKIEPEYHYSEKARAYRSAY